MNNDARRRSMPIRVLLLASMRTAIGSEDSPAGAFVPVGSIDDHGGDDDKGQVPDRQARPQPRQVQMPLERKDVR